MTMNSSRQGTLRELDHRRSNGIDVSLLWDEQDNRVVVSVVDDLSGKSFDLEVPPESALHVFRHPYAHAGLKGLKKTPRSSAA